MDRSLTIYLSGRNIQQVYFRQPYYQCQPGATAFMVHSAQGHADRITVCEWLLEPFINHWVQGESWDTRITINNMRSLLPAQPSNPMSPGIPIELENLIQSRNQWLERIGVSNLPNWNRMSDIDMTVGFDSWMIYIVKRPR